MAAIVWPGYTGRTVENELACNRWIVSDDSGIWWYATGTGATVGLAGFAARSFTHRVLGRCTEETITANERVIANTEGSYDFRRWQTRHSILAVSELGSIARSVTNGESWVQASAPVGLYVADHAFVYELHADAPDGIWLAVGDNGTIARSLDDGQSWSDVSSGLSGYNLRGVGYDPRYKVWLVVGSLPTGGAIAATGPQSGLGPWTMQVLGPFVIDACPALAFSGRTWVMVASEEYRAVA